MGILPMIHGQDARATTKEYMKYIQDTTLVLLHFTLDSR